MAEYEMNRAELEKRLNHIVNKTLGEVDEKNVFDKTIDKPKITGIAGDVIEQSVLGYPANSDQEPDIMVDGIPIEVKTTGIRYNKRAKKRGNLKNSDFEAKEPMSITAVSPQKIVNETFKLSNFWHKLEHMLIVYYHYDSDVPVKSWEYQNFYIKGYDFRDIPKEDQEVLQSDWNKVHQYVSEQTKKYEDTKSPEFKDAISKMSSALRPELMYIDLAPRKTPRFRLKRSYVTGMVQDFFNNKYEGITKQLTNIDNIKEILHQNTEKYKYKTFRELTHIFGLEEKYSKSLAEQIVVRMFGSETKKITNIPIFKKADISLKTITVTENRKRTEDTKLGRLYFSELMENENFENSPFYTIFADKIFIFVLFEEAVGETDPLNNKFLGFKWITFDDDFIYGSVKKAWEHTYQLIESGNLKEDYVYTRNGEKRKNKNNTYQKQLNFIKSKENDVFLRGTGQDSNDKTEILNGISMYKQYIWIKGKAIVDMLNKKPFI